MAKTPDDYVTASDNVGSDSDTDSSDGNSLGIDADPDTTRRYPLRNRTQRQIPGAVLYDPSSNSSSFDDEGEWCYSTLSERLMSQGILGMSCMFISVVSSVAMDTTNFVLLVCI